MAWQHGPRGKASTTASLDRPCAQRVISPQVGTKERPQARTKEQCNKLRSLSMT